MDKNFEIIANYFLEDTDKSPGSFYAQHIKPFEPGNFYDKYIKPYENDVGSNVNSDNFKTPEEDNAKSKDFNNFEPEINKLEPDPISGDYDYSSIQPDLVEAIVKNLEGYKYDVKQDGNTIIIIFDQKIGSDLVRKWAKVFPENKFKGIPVEIETKEQGVN